MRKIIALLSCVFMTLGLSACGRKITFFPSAPPSTNPSASDEIVLPEPPASTEPEAVPETTENPIVVNPAPAIEETESTVEATDSLVEETTTDETTPDETISTEETSPIEETDASDNTDETNENISTENQSEGAVTVEPDASMGNNSPETEVDISGVELPVVANRDYPEDGEVIYTDHWVNVRSKPSLDGEVIGKIEEGEELFRFENKNGWSKIQFDGNKIGYISNKYIDTELTETFKLYKDVDETVYAGHDVNIRTAPGGDILGKLKQGKSVRRISVGENGWSQCIWRNKLVYINSEYLSTDPSFEIPLEYFLNAKNGTYTSSTGTDDTNESSTETSATEPTT